MLRGRLPVVAVILSTGIAGILFLAFGVDVLCRIPVRHAIGNVDSNAEFGQLSITSGIVLMRDLDLPERNLHIENAVVYWSGSIFDPSIDSILVLGGCWEPSGEKAPEATSAGGEARMPPIRFADISMVSETDSSFACGTLTPSPAGTRVSLRIVGDWGMCTGTGLLGASCDSARIQWFRLSRVPGDIISLPEMLSEADIQGNMVMVRTDHTSATGNITSVGGESSDIRFSIDDSPGYTQVGVSSQLEDVRDVLEAQASRLLGDVNVTMNPQGTFTLGFTNSDTVEVAVDAFLDSVRIFSPGLAPDTVNCELRLSFSGDACIGTWDVRVDSGLITVDELPMNFCMDGKFGDDPRIHIRLWNEDISGDELVSSIPEELLGRLRGLRLQGSCSAVLDVVLDWGCPDSSDFDADIDVGGLRVAYSPVSVGQFRSGGSCLMRDSWGGSRRIYLDTLENDDFVAFDSLHPCFEGLLKCAEDATFRTHHGFCQYHIRNSIRADMQSGRFTRGGSTISMQLARNLFLGREKTLARKIQEVFLTWRLEQYLSKDRILEIYANIVELGPDVFGFDQAGRYYFGRDLRHLSTREVAYLVSILPGPKLYHRFFASGRVPDYWEAYLDRLISISGQRGWIPSDSAASALEDSIVFRVPENAI